MREFSIGEVVAETGVTESTLRAWEHRYGFPSPGRLASGHRRYGAQDIEAIKGVMALRDSGLPLVASIERAQQAPERPSSLHAQLLSDHPELNPQLLSRQKLLALTHAIEDETCARAERPVMFGSFQREYFYRHEEARWRQFAMTAELVCVFADFERKRCSARGPVEVPLGEEDHLAREWSIVCDAPGYCVCVSGWEAPRSARMALPERLFETVWSVEPRIVRSAAKACAAIARPSIPALIDGLQDRLDLPELSATGEQVRLATAITNRTLAYLT